MYVLVAPGNIQYSFTSQMQNTYQNTLADINTVNFILTSPKTWLSKLHLVIMLS